MTDPARVYHLALRDVHASLGATFAVHTGWSLPERYGDFAAEHTAIRGHAALVDRSQRSRFIVSGTDALDVLQATFTGHLRELEEGRAMRTVALDDAGRIRDLALVARTGGIAYLVVGEPGQRFETRERLQAAAGPDFDVRIDDRTETTCLLGLAGPAAADVACEHLSDGLPARLQQLHAVTFEFHGFRTLATRTSDLGEDGFEFMLAPPVAQHVIETLRGAGVPLAGTAAQEVARVESCIPAFDPDLAPGLSPAEADLDLLLGIPGGADARILAAVLIESETILDPGTPLLAAGARAGELRSCVRSPALGATLGLAIIASRSALPGIELELAGHRAMVVAKPFYRRRN
ncbi:MAG: hypothetical protein HYX53_12865 [Chloroflexi bacterium]|nr:hypothetical protein [Chloroflexota bacterium]